MSLANFFGDVFAGNFSNAAKRIEDWFSSLPAPVQAFLKKVGTDEYTIMKGLVAVAVNDIAAGGFTTTSFVTAGKDVLAKLIAQNITTFTLQDVMADINMAVVPLVPADKTGLA